MKNQFFGDENDYKKYGLLRYLTPAFPEGTTVCWMLTPDDGTRLSNSTFYSYFDKPQEWRAHDPELFDSLLGFVCTPGKFARRGVALARKIPGIESMKIFEEEIPHATDERSEWFDRLEVLTKGTGLVFFDPDTGMQTDSCPDVKARSDAHLYWDELQRFYNGHKFSVLLYQHFPRIDHDEYIDQTASQISDLLKAKRIISFKTSQMFLILIPQERHWEKMSKVLPKIETQWGNRISAKIHESQDVVRI